MAKSLSMKRRDPERDEAWLEEFYARLLDQICGNLEKNCTGFEREVVERICRIRNVPVHYRQRLESDAEIWKRIQKEAARISIEGRGPKDAIRAVAEMGAKETTQALDRLSKIGAEETKQALNSLSKLLPREAAERLSKHLRGRRLRKAPSLKRPDWLLLSLVHYLESWSLEGPDLYGTAISIAIYARALRTKEFDLEKGFDVFEDPGETRRVSEIVRKRVIRAREKLTEVLVFELGHWDELRDAYGLAEDHPLGEWLPERWGMTLDFRPPDAVERADYFRQVTAYEYESEELAEAKSLSVLLRKPRFVSSKKLSRGAILGHKRRTTNRGIDRSLSDS